jgi:hypothetical protein
MKKPAFFLIFFIFLVCVGWGQTEFIWTGGTNGDWDDPSNWTVVNANGVSSPFYPGDSGRVDDIVIIDAPADIYSPSIILSGNIIIKDLKIDNDNTHINTDNYTLTVTDKTELNGRIGIVPFGVSSSSQMNITNLIIAAGSGAGIVNDSNVRMNGALVSMDAYYDGTTITIEPVTGDIGYIDAGNRPVVINIDDNSGPITIGDITTGGTNSLGTGGITINIGNDCIVDISDITSDGDITINVDNNSDVSIGDISSGGNVIIDIPPTSTIDINDSDPPPNISGGGNVNIGGSNTYTWTGDGIAGDWDDPDNWQAPNNSPGAGDPAYKIIILKSTPANDPVFSDTELLCDTLTIHTDAGFDLGSSDLTAGTLANHGNLILEGGQSVTITTVTANETVTYNAAGAAFAGLSNFKNLTVQDGDRTGVGAIIVTGNFRLEGGSLDAASINVTGTSLIAGNITTTGNQTYTGDVTLDGSNPPVLTSSGGNIQTGGDTSGAVGIIIEADNGITIGAGGINVTGFDVTFEAGGNIEIQGAITGAVVTLKAGGDIDTQSPITGDQLIVTAVGDVTVSDNITVTSAGDHDTPPGDGSNAAIYIKANDFIPTGAVIITPGTGEMCLELTVDHSDDSFDGFVFGNKYHVHNVESKSLVYYNSSHPSFTTLSNLQLLFSPAVYNFIDAAIDASTTFTAAYDKEIIIYQIGSNSKDVTFMIGGASPTGSISIYGDYSADDLTLNTGSGGVWLFNADIELTGDFTISNNEKLTLGGTSASSIKAANIILEDVIVNGTDRITLEAVYTISAADAEGAAVSLGGGTQIAPVEISISGELGDVTINQGSYIKVKTGENIFQANQKTLELKDNAVLDLSSGSWKIGNGTQVQNSFTGYYGVLKLGEDSKLVTYNFNLTGAAANLFTVYNDPGWASVSVIGDEVNIGASVDLMPEGSDIARFIIKMDGDGSQDITTSQTLGSLHIGEKTQVFLRNDLRLSGEMLIKNTSDTQGVLNAGSYNITMYAGLLGEQKNGFTNPVTGRWRVEGVTETISSSAPVSTYPMSDAFRQNTGGFVEFKKGTADGQIFFEIAGNTVWRKFVCHEPGAIIQFSMYPDQHVFLDTFDVKGVSGNHITLTRYIDPNDAAKAGWSIIYNNNYVPDGASDGSLIDFSLPAVPAMKDMKNEGAPYTELSKFWNFNLVSTGAPGYSPLDVENIDVYFSHAWNRQIPISSAGVNLIPFYRSAGTGSRKGYFNYDWGNEGRTIIYSFAEDGNGNGKVDRIRVQTNVKLNADFRNFDVEVEGYKIDASRGQAAIYSGDSTPNGFDLVSRRTGDPADDGSFYIYIEEIDALYDGKPINWRVTKNNNSLKDHVTQMLQVGDQNSGEVYTTVNTIPPRVSFALTLPGHPQTFVQMTQPVSPYNDTLIIDGNRRPGTQGYTVIDRTLSERITLEYYPFEEAPKQYNVIIPDGALNYLLELDSSPAAASLANLPPIGINVPGEYFTLQGLKGLTVRAIDWNDPLVDPISFNYYPPPRYPVDWNYSGYSWYSGNSHIQGLSADDNIKNTTPVFLPPFELLTPEMTRRLEVYAKDTASGAAPSVLPVTPGSFTSSAYDDKKRRSTDVLVSITPQDMASNYFAWPVWARYNAASSGVVWDFDGTSYLEDSDVDDIAIQVRLFGGNDFNALGFNGLSLFYGFEVPAQWRNPAEAAQRGKGTGGLWLPMDSSNNINPLYSIVPGKTVDINSGRIGFYPANKQSATASGLLCTFNVNNSHFSNGGKIEFVLRLDGNNDSDPNLFIARLDSPSGVIPGNWYELIRPFSFDILNTRQQRGGVTILNNVINSDKKEITYIRYNIPRSGRVTVQIYTLDGTLVKSVRRNEQREAGTYLDTWDGSNNGGRPVARGMYFVRVVGPDIDEIRKIMVVK